MALEFLSPVAASPLGVDTANRVIRGVVLAQTGPFHSGRGEFDGQSLSAIKRLVNAEPAGVKSRMGHPNPSHPGSKEELTGFVGRFSDARIDGDKVRADERLDPTAFLPPPGGGTSYGEYLLARARSDPASLATSLVLETDKEYRKDNHGKPRRDINGNTLPPLWRPTAIQAADFVGHGDATPDGLLAVSGNVVSGDAMIRLRQSWRQTKLANEAPPTAEDLRRSWRQKRDALAGTAGDNDSSKASGGYIPQGGAPGVALAGVFRSPLLRDFTARPWSSLSLADRQRIAQWFAWCSSPALDSFSDDLHLPYRFPRGAGQHGGHASLSGVRAALARVDQTKAVPATEREKVRRFLEGFLPGGFRKSN